MPWLDKLTGLAEEPDIIAIHTYPVWEYKTVAEAMAYTRENFDAVQSAYPDKQVIITEAGWATASNGRGILPENVGELFQETYLRELLEWAEEEEILVCVFEAFDENWKGSDHPLEPENTGVFIERIVLANPHCRSNCKNRSRLVVVGPGYCGIARSNR